jgi:hypothetical protein
MIRWPPQLEKVDLADALAETIVRIAGACRTDATGHSIQK